jgi:predicted dinucleotide-binding enzyme
LFTQQYGEAAAVAAAVEVMETWEHKQAAQVVVLAIPLGKYQCLLLL